MKLISKNLSKSIWTTFAIMWSYWAMETKSIPFAVIDFLIAMCILHLFVFTDPES